LYFSSQSPSPSDLYTLSLHDALPILPYNGRQPLQHQPRFARKSKETLSRTRKLRCDDVGFNALFCTDVPCRRKIFRGDAAARARSEEHTSELQSRFDLVCRLLLEKKK